MDRPAACYVGDAELRWLEATASARV